MRTAYLREKYTIDPFRLREMALHFGTAPPVAVYRYTEFHNSTFLQLFLSSDS